MPSSVNSPRVRKSMSEYTLTFLTRASPVGGWTGFGRGAFAIRGM